MTSKHSIELSKAILDLGRMSEDRAAGAYTIVAEEGSKGILSAACAQILDLGFDCIDGLEPQALRSRQMRRYLLLVMFPRDPSRDEIHALVRAAILNVPQSILVVTARGREVEDFAQEMRDADEEMLVVTCHF